MSDSVVELAHHEEARALFGLRDENLRRLCSVTGARVVLRGNQVRITGEPENVDQLVEGLLTLQASPALRENYRTHGLAAAKHYDRNQLALDMLAVLQHAVADPVRVSALPEEGKHEC